MSKLIGSAPTLEKLLEGAQRFFCSDAVRFLQRDSDEVWDVTNSKGVIKGVIVIRSGRRYRMEML